MTRASRPARPGPSGAPRWCMRGCRDMRDGAPGIGRAPSTKNDDAAGPPPATAGPPRPQCGWDPRAPYNSLSARLSILPGPVFGISATNSIDFGTL